MFGVSPVVYRSATCATFVGEMEHALQVCDCERRVLVEVLGLDEALEQIPAHGRVGWVWYIATRLFMLLLHPTRGSLKHLGRVWGYVD